MSRTFLIPAGLSGPFWNSLAEGVDAVWEDTIDSKALALARLHQTRIPTEVGSIQPEASLDLYDKETLIKILFGLGLSSSALNALTQQQLARLRSTISSYWMSVKGRRQFTDYIRYVLGIKVKVVTLYTNNYSTFYEEGSPSIGQLLPDGGTWYPTSRVNVYVKPADLGSLTQSNFKELFAALSPYTMAPANWYFVNF